MLRHQKVSLGRKIVSVSLRVTSQHHRVICRAGPQIEDENGDEQPTANRKLQTANRQPPTANR